jgi:hypothetical protein
MAREDISDKLVHFTKGDTLETAFTHIRAIISESRLTGGNGFVKGGYRCVCFSEAPAAALEHGLLNSSAYSRYSPFGIMFEKSWIFEQGGRPVIYQPDSEYAALPESHKWRHVRYEPNAEEPNDFTWEREWRIQTDELNFSPSVAAVVVPDRDWAERLIAEHESEQDFKTLQYSQIMDEELARQYRDTFDWLIYVLR